MSDSKEQNKEGTPTRFLLYIAAGVIALILSLFAVGAVLTHFLWPPQDKLSRPVIYQESQP